MKTCKNCGDDIPEGSYSNRQHCSKKCKDNFYYKKKKLREPEKFLYWRAKRRASERGLDFNLDLEDIVIPEVCPLFGVPLGIKSYVKGEFGAEDNSPSLDRIDNSKGYIKGNIRIICNRANVLRSNASKKELEVLLNDCINLEKQGFSV